MDQDWTNYACIGSKCISISQNGSHAPSTPPTLARGKTPPLHWRGKRCLAFQHSSSDFPRPRDQLLHELSSLLDERKQRLKRQKQNIPPSDEPREGVRNKDEQQCPGNCVAHLFHIELSDCRQYFRNWELSSM